MRPLLTARRSGRIVPRVEAPPTHEPLDQTGRVASHAATLDRLVFLTQLADGKTAPLLALHATIAAVTLASSNDISDLFSSGVKGTAVGLLIAAYALSTVAVLVLALQVYFPVLRQTGHSHTFFEDIRLMSRDDFVRQSLELSGDALERELLDQVHASSGIVSQKFRQLRVAFRLSAITLAAWVPLMMLVVT